ncbi:MAG TPA: class I SAM-dependent methyltransferase [Candidatus Dormibacteraeota bacterium]|nr:class I SAM-dependent methyltransferase [Candidatus Dormibacteraeota bacterium]
MTSETYFNEVAAQWEQIRASFFSEAVRDQAIAVAGVQPGKLAADIGAGTGFITEGLVKLGVRVVAVDQSEAMLAELQRKFAAGSGIDVRVGNGEAIPIPDDSVDYVFANMYLHHVEEPQQAIGEMVRILKPNGRLVITDLDEHQVEFLQTEHHDRWLGFQRSDLDSWLRNAGLQAVAVVSTDQQCTSTSSQGPASATIGIFLASGRKR